MQSKKLSLLESCVNVAVGYLVSLAGQILIFPLFGISVKVSENLLIGLLFTILSIVRSYTLRRIFNHVK